jgi:Cu/Zn superoxide dismutase
MTPLLAAAALALAAANPTETVQLGKLGTVTAGQQGSGTLARFSLHGLPAGTRARAVLNAGTCKRPSASFAGAGSARVDPRGRAVWKAKVPVAWSIVADGGHVFRVVGANGKPLACGVVPGMS